MAFKNFSCLVDSNKKKTRKSLIVTQWRRDFHSHSHYKRRPSSHWNHHKFVSSTSQKRERIANTMIGVKNRNASLGASNLAGVFLPRQLQGAFDSSTSIAMNFSPSLFRITPSNSSSSLSDLAPSTDDSTASTRNSTTSRRGKRRDEMSRVQVGESVRLILCSFSSLIPEPSMVVF